ncbi:MAG: hypothetical protein SAL07_03025 [Oscillatoria sp. PMC 1051.18]|nr:hypothetical protein [Oscillatoria sp. PMC 1050.18]MEC5028861.1 hypothetical protein [Oscillatoria sp. PMC 1051.18]
MSAIAFGSINLDLVVGVPHLPQVGETVSGDKFFTALGGKAASLVRLNGSRLNSVDELVAFVDTNPDAALLTIQRNQDFNRVRVEF